MGRTALLIVDVQRDFLPGGALGVPGGDSVIAPLAAAAALADVVVASRDAHPPDHVSFAARGGPWPVHCVVGTPGAALDPRIAALPLDRVVDKGTEAARDAYSAFDGTDLAGYLRGEGVDRVLIGGLATDYCVRATALDALAQGFETAVLAAASRAVDVGAGDGERALAELESAGAEIVRS
jgi:nicotinamidase/pyrazinamidase